jgi:deoxyribonuclease IV
MNQIAAKDLLIGAHCSAAGGVFNALYEGQSIGATTIQLFTANQRTWASKPIEDEVVEKWKQALDETGLKEIMSHDSYLINLGAPDPENLRKSRHLFEQEIERCLTLGISYLNFHPGAAIDDPVEKCLDRIVWSLLATAPLLEGGKTTLLLETTAGQGSSVGYRFEEIGYILERVKGQLPIGVCFDTCHCFCAGYDLRTAEEWDKTLQEFDQLIGLENLRAFHVNDSLKPFASRKDRHACLGKGEIGIEAFRCLMTDRRTRDIPKYLETPEGPACWKEEIKMLRQFAEG